MPDVGTLALIGLGSNLGDRKATLDAAVAALAETPGCTLRGVSSYHETAPVGGPGGQGAFLNAAAAVETDLDPIDLLRALQRIEARLGRVRTVRWGERTLDLDLLLHGDRAISTPPVCNRVFGGWNVVLRLPHPRLAVRRFVLAPVAEIAPGAVEPFTGRTVADLLANLDRRPSLVAVYDPDRKAGDSRLVKTLYPTLVKVLGGVGLSYAQQDEDFRRRVLARQSLVDTGRLEGPRYEEATASCRDILEAWVEQLCGDLSIRVRGAEPGGDGWLVTDTWPDATYVMARSIGIDPGPILGRLVEARPGSITPTFVIVPEGRRRDLSRLGRDWPAPLGDAPMIEIDPDADPAAMVEEALATCTATRPA